MKVEEAIIRVMLVIFITIFAAFIVYGIEWGIKVLKEDSRIKEDIPKVEKRKEEVVEVEIGEKREDLNNSTLYTIHEERINDVNDKYINRGVYYDSLNTINAPSFYYISMGQKNTGGYSIEIIDVIIEDNNNYTVVVKESSPAKDAIVTMAFTTPVCMIEFKSLPDNIKFINQYGDEFNHINF